MNRRAFVTFVAAMFLFATPAARAKAFFARIPSFGSTFGSAPNVAVSRDGRAVIGGAQFENQLHFQAADYWLRYTAFKWKPESGFEYFPEFYSVPGDKFTLKEIENMVRIVSKKCLLLLLYLIFYFLL